MCAQPDRQRLVLFLLGLVEDSQPEQAAHWIE
jgi:hypothetical protein